MPRVLFGKYALAELEQLIDGLARVNSKQAFATADVVANATSVLQQNPLTGCPLPGGLHELTISCGDGALLALYRYLALEDRVEILTVQSVAGNQE